MAEKKRRTKKQRPKKQRTKFRVFCGEAEVGTVRAYSGAQAIGYFTHKVGPVCSGDWRAEPVDPKQQISPADWAEIVQTFPRSRQHSLRCRSCGYFDPSPMADTCPNCGTRRYGGD